MTSGFTGFPTGTVTFFEELSAHNERAWFEANKARYEADVLDPARSFVSAMGQRLAPLAPGIVADGRTNRSVFRIYRDTRFSKDKTPYKTHLGLWLWEGDRPRMECSGFYFHLEPPKLMVGAGLYQFSKPMLQAYRDAVDEDPAGGELAAIAADLVASGATLGGQSYARVPNGYAKDHPRADLLRHGGLYAGIEVPIPPELHQPALVDWCAERFERLVPLHRWLNQMIARVEA